MTAQKSSPDKSRVSRSVNTGRRLDDLERHVVRHSESIDGIVGDINSLRDRVGGLERHKQDIEVHRAREEERDIALNTRLSNIEGSVSDIKSTNSRIMWMILTAVIMGLLAIVIRPNIG